MAGIVEQLRRAIIKSGLSHYELAKRSGVSRAVIARFVAGERDIRLDTAERLAEALRLTLAEEQPPK